MAANARRSCTSRAKFGTATSGTRRGSPARNCSIRSDSPRASDLIVGEVRGQITRLGLTSPEGLRDHARDLFHVLRADLRALLGAADRC